MTAFCYGLRACLVIGRVSKQRLFIHDLLLHPSFTFPGEQPLKGATS